MTAAERKLLADLAERGPMRTTNGRPFTSLFEAGFISRCARIAQAFRINSAGKAALERGRFAPSDMVPIELVVRELRDCAHCSARFFPESGSQRYCAEKCRSAAKYLRGRRFSLPTDGARARWTK